MKNNAKKRRMYEAFIESVPLLKSLEVSLIVVILSLLFYFVPPHVTFIIRPSLHSLRNGLFNSDDRKTIYFVINGLQCLHDHNLHKLHVSTLFV